MPDCRVQNVYNKCPTFAFKMSTVRRGLNVLERAAELQRSDPSASLEAALAAAAPALQASTAPPKKKPHRNPLTRIHGDDIRAVVQKFVSTCSKLPAQILEIGEAYIAELRTKYDF